MASKNKRRREASPEAARPSEQPRQKDPPVHPSQNATRETLESLAIAFILAFFIRTFVVEPFVIPTGSMSPALQGVHKDVNCPKCGERYRVNASQQAQIRGHYPPDRCVGGMCPMCRYTMAYDLNLARRFPDRPEDSANEPSYSGDRIVVNKFLYSFSEPERWDVVVFKYPGNATDNYIKRLVGLPEETLRIYGGDLFAKAEGEEVFRIQRKPPSVVKAMRQEVHDTQRDALALYEAGWPLRWLADDDNGGEKTEGWQLADQPTDNRVLQRYSVSGEGEHWLRYVHTPPTSSVWPAIENRATLPPARPKLIGDFNSYNTRIPQMQVDQIMDIVARTGLGSPTNPFFVSEFSQEIHWVGDLLVEADVDIEEATGEMLLELVEAGHRFRCRIDLSSGRATLEIVRHGEDAPVSDFQPTAETVLRTAGEHQVMFANVDDALYLWVDGRLVDFPRPTTYDWQALFGPREEAIPRTGENDRGDLAPVGIGSAGASLVVDRLRVWRDMYYIAAESQLPVSNMESIVADYPAPPPADLLYNHREWDRIGRRRQIDFKLDKDQFFVMGDNSPQSSDARLWTQQPPGSPSKPGGNYLERQLLIGRAISVVWPHPWYNVIPGFTDMRRIR